MEIEIEEDGPPFEILEAVEVAKQSELPPGQQQSTKLCSINRRLGYEEVVDMIFNTSEDLCTCWPPYKPKNGDIFLFTFQDEKHHFDFVADGMNWRNQGTRLYSRDNFVVKKRYYKRRIGQTIVDFKKCVFEVGSVNRVLIHYFGEQDEEMPEAPHGNRKTQLDKGHIRVMPSVLSDIRESKEGPSQIFNKMAGDARIPPEIFQVARPRNMKQVENRKQYEKRHSNVERCNVAEVDGLLELNTELIGFIKYLRLLPCFNVVMINEHLLQEFAHFITTGDQCMVSCVTRLRFQEYYVTYIVGRYHQYDSEPGIPLAYAIHHRLTTESYQYLLREMLKLAPELNSENLIMIGEKDKYVQEAWTTVMTQTRCFVSWESLKRSALNSLKKLKFTSLQKKHCLEDISKILMSRTEAEYNELLSEFEFSWPHEFMRSYRTNLGDDVFRCRRGALLEAGCYKSDAGVRVVESNCASCLMHSLSAWPSASLVGVSLACFMLSAYCQYEVAKSRCGVGIWKLKAAYQHMVRSLDEEEIASDVPKPQDIVVAVKRRFNFCE